MPKILRYDISEVNRCLLCLEPECSKACPKGAPVGDALRSLYFDNVKGALRLIGDTDCSSCDAPCEKSCLLGRKNSPVRIRSVMTGLAETAKDVPPNKIETVDVSTDICGVRLENPFLLSSSVVASSYDMCRRAFEAGWAGISYKTICSFPQHEASPRFAVIHNHSNSFCGFKNIEQLSDHSVIEDLDIIRRLHAEFPTKVIIASIMGRNEEEWTFLASECEKAGASVIECNFSCPNLEDGELGITIGQSEVLVERFSRAVRKGTSIPVLAKLTPNVADMVPLALAAKRGGMDGISAINTINSITGVNLNTLVAEPAVRGRTIIGGYSGPAVKPIALNFIASLASYDELKDMHISGMGGIETWKDAMEFILLGAGSVQVTTSVMQYGYRIIDDLLGGLRYYMMKKGIGSLKSLIGGAIASVVDHPSIERDTVVFPVFNKSRCIGCGRCYISCMDGGHQAIRFDPKTKIPQLIAEKCVGCHLCRMTCPVRAVDKAPKAIRK